MSVLQIDRRTFLKVGGTAAGGLLVGCYVRRERGHEPSDVQAERLRRIDRRWHRDAVVEESRHGAGHQDDACR